MSMLEKDLQEVDLDAAEEALDDTDDVTVEEDAFEKALGREDRQSTQSLDATQIYLNEIGFSPLLTPEEEVYYGRLARKGDPLA